MTPNEQRHALACVRALEALQAAAAEVCQSWDSGNLAGAVCNLDGARDSARVALQRYKRAARDVARRDDPIADARETRQNLDYFKR